MPDREKAWRGQCPAVRRTVTGTLAAPSLVRQRKVAETCDWARTSYVAVHGLPWTVSMRIPEDRKITTCSFVRAVPVLAGPSTEKASAPLPRMASVTDTAPDGETSSWSGWPAEVRSVDVDDELPTWTTAVAGSVTSESSARVSVETVEEGDGEGEPLACGDPPELPEVQEALSATAAITTAALMLLRSSPPGLRSTYLLGVTLTVPERPARLMLSPAIKADRW